MTRKGSYDSMSTPAIQQGELLAALGAELGVLGYGVGVSEAWPSTRIRLAVHTGIPGEVLWVTVCGAVTHFTWQLADHRHPVTDVRGAARSIAAFLSARPAG